MSRSWMIALAFAGVLIAGIVVLRFQNRGETLDAALRASIVGCREVEAAYRQRYSGVWLTVSAPVSRLLPDAYGTYPHQRFILRCSRGQTVLIVNDVAFGRRVPVQIGESVAVHGQYVWNRLGGLVHYTHHGGGNVAGGWILIRRRLYSFGSSTRSIAWRRDGTDAGQM